MLKSDKRQHIMLAAEKLFTTRRFHEITLDDIAHKAKIGKGTIYLYFGNKDDLFFQTATSGFEELCQLLQNAPQAVNFREELLTACTQITDFFEKRHQLFRMMNDENFRLCFAKGGNHERWLKKRQLLLIAVTAIIKRGVEESHIRDDIEPEVLAAFLLGMLRTRAMDLGEAAENMRSHTIIIDLFCNGAFSNSKKEILI
jgi:AcrR family transcriptional regulator